MTTHGGWTIPRDWRWWARLVELAAVAAVIYGVADLVFSWNPLAAAPYGTWRHLPAFRGEPLLWFGAVAESVNGWVVTLGYLALRSGAGAAGVAGTGSRAWRRVGWRLGLLAWGFWVVSGTMTAFVWLAVPWSVAAVNVAFGLPKCLAIGWAVAWYGGRRLPVEGGGTGLSGGARSG